MKGQIKFYKMERGYGFITGEDCKDYFFHFKEIMNKEFLSKDDLVEFKPDSNEKGLVAKEIFKRE